MIAILIVNYKDEERTISYIKEEISKVQSPCIIVVINNAATNESDAILLNKLDAVLVTDIYLKPIKSKCYVISHSDNPGFAKGNNIGAEFSMKHFEITHFVITNNDIRFLNNDVVERLIEKLDSLTHVGMIGPQIIGLDGKKQSPEPYFTFWNRYIWMYWLTPFLSSTKKIKIFKLDYSQEAMEGEHYKIMGSFFIVKALDFKNCGMMDSNTFLYAEEMILSERLKGINKKVYYCPKVAVIHEHGQTINQHFNSVKSMRLQFSSECYYYQTYLRVSSFSIFLGKLSLNTYIKLKSRLNQ